MKKNVGICDKGIRIALAVLIGVLYFFNIITGFWGIVLLVFAVVLLITGFLNTCGLYSVFGINTCSKKKE